jgi:hypothetical protein
MSRTPPSAPHFLALDDRLRDHPVDRRDRQSAASVGQVAYKIAGRVGSDGISICVILYDMAFERGCLVICASMIVSWLERGEIQVT